jgi:hypothetical protein
VRVDPVYIALLPHVRPRGPRYLSDHLTGTELLSSAAKFIRVCSQSAAVHVGACTLVCLLSDAMMKAFASRLAQCACTCRISCLQGLACVASQILVRVCPISSNIHMKTEEPPLCKLNNFDRCSSKDHQIPSGCSFFFGRGAAFVCFVMRSTSPPLCTAC